VVEKRFGPNFARGEEKPEGVDGPGWALFERVKGLVGYDIPAVASAGSSVNTAPAGGGKSAAASYKSPCVRERDPLLEGEGREVEPVSTDLSDPSLLNKLQFTQVYDAKRDGIADKELFDNDDGDGVLYHGTSIMEILGADEGGSGGGVEWTKVDILLQTGPKVPIASGYVVNLPATGGYYFDEQILPDEILVRVTGVHAPEVPLFKRVATKPGWVRFGDMASDLPQDILWFWGRCARHGKYSAVLPPSASDGGDDKTSATLGGAAGEDSGGGEKAPSSSSKTPKQPPIKLANVPKYPSGKKQGGESSKSSRRKSSSSNQWMREACASSNDSNGVSSTAADGSGRTACEGNAQARNSGGREQKEEG